MKAALTESWNTLSGRDRRWLIAGAILAGLLVLWNWLWDPLASSRAALRVQAGDNERALQWMRPAAQALAARGGARVDRAPDDGRSLLARVDAGARAAGLAAGLVGVEPLGGDRVRVRFGSAPFDPLVAWLESEAGRGLAIEEMSLRRAGAVGLVDGQVLLREESR